MPCCENPHIMESGFGDKVCFSCFQVQEEPQVKVEPEVIVPSEGSLVSTCCKDPYIIPDRKEGQYTCQNCGKITDSLYTEYYCFDEDGTATHVEGGRVGDSRQIIRGMPASKWCMIALTARDRVLFKSSHILTGHHLPSSISDVVLEIFDSFEHTQGMRRGKDLNTVSAVLVYLALKKMGIYRTAQECAAYVDVSLKKFNKVLKFVDSKAQVKSSEHIPAKNVIVNQYCSLLQVGNDVKKRVHKVLQIIEQEPMSLNAKVAIAFYHAKNETLEELLTLLNIRRPTVKKNYEKVIKLIESV